MRFEIGDLVTLAEYVECECPFCIKLRNNVGIVEEITLHDMIIVSVDGKRLFTEYNKSDLEFYEKVGSKYKPGDKVIITEPIPNFSFDGSRKAASFVGMMAEYVKKRGNDAIGDHTVKICETEDIFWVYDFGIKKFTTIEIPDEIWEMEI